MANDASAEFNALLGELLRRETRHTLENYHPYAFQKAWHNAKGYGTDSPAKQKALMCANQIGKSFCGCCEDAIHATGLYPDWWEGSRFDRPVKILVSGVTCDKVRDTLQTLLFGDPHDDEALGTGLIPRDRIVGKPVRKQGYVNAYDSVPIRSEFGGVSRIHFQAYEQGFKKFMATGIDVNHPDEEPPPDIYSQLIRSVIATKGIINLTFTPEDGITDVVDGFINNLQEGQALVTAGWDDAPHIANDPEHRAQLLAALRPHEREMRSKGIPQMGSGLIYPVSDDLLRVDPFDIPPYWPRIAAIDYGGFEHPFAAVWIAWNRDENICYVYKTYANMGAMPIHAHALVQGGCDWIPIAWPHDVGHTDKKSGKPLADIFRDEYGLNMLPKVFSNPPAPGEREGQGGQGVEAGLYAIHNAMETGRFKVFASEAEWFREKSIYHRKDGKIVKRKDDLMDATRYAFQSLRFADVRPFQSDFNLSQVPKGARNW